MKLWTRKEENRIVELCPNSSVRDIADELGTSRYFVKCKLKDMGLYETRRPPNWSLSEDEKIIRLYPNTDNRIVAGILGRTYNSILIRASKLGVAKTRDYSSRIRREYVLNEHYFDTINNDQTAYWLGFLWADGYVHTKGNGIQFRLQVSDRDMVEKLHLSLKTDAPIITEIREREINGIPTPYEGVGFTVCSAHMKDVLSEQYNIHPRKTYRQDIPSIPQLWLSHFVRGVFDGDGTITHKDRGITKGFVSIVGTNAFCEWMLEVTRNELLVGGSTAPEKRSLFAHYWNLDGRLQLQKFAAWIYKDATVFMQRKYDKFKAFGLI